MPKYEKTSSESKVYSINWETLLDAESDGAGQTISTSEWSATPVGLTLGTDTVDNANKRANVPVSGGEAGTTYAITNRITTNAGQVFDDFIFLYVY